MADPLSERQVIRDVYDSSTDALRVSDSGITSTPTYTVVSVTTSATPLPATPLSGRRSVFVRNAAMVDIIMCDSAGNLGLTLQSGDSKRYNVQNDSTLLYAKVSTGTANLEVEEVK